ncbi:helix-turn-helix transcriptional regulator [Pseudodesulfovibrio indicus]|uniref:helix-turn-helix transcriptional regulator n=1 Tax=Pseudodesulfovibrio indicus TaxID=1716143 RepID=UPI00292E9DE4|nr:helix-turn-helix transcriptional regulator [Pseudodesulfovibrio indicus]
MPKQTAASYSQYTREAGTLLGRLIREGRKMRGWTLQELADRAGMSRRTMQRVESGDLNCRIGAVFEAATLVGVHLFEPDRAGLAKHLRHVEDKLRLLPKAARVKRGEVDDDF